MTIGQKILKFDETDQTAKDFKELFSIDLNVPESTEVAIGDMTLGGLREVIIDGKESLLDLFEEGRIKRYERRD